MIGRGLFSVDERSSPPKYLDRFRGPIWIIPPPFPFLPTSNFPRAFSAFRALFLIVENIFEHPRSARAALDFLKGTVPLPWPPNANPRIILVKSGLKSSKSRRDTHARKVHTCSRRNC